MSGDVGAGPKCGSQTPIGHRCIVDDLEAIRTSDLSETPLGKAIAAGFPTSPSGDVGAEVAAVLAAHWEIDVENGGDQTEFFCDGCKATLLVGTGDADAAHLAHVATALEPLIAVRVEAAKAEGENFGWQVAHDEACERGPLCSAHQPIAGRRRAAALDPEATP